MIREALFESEWVKNCTARLRTDEKCDNSGLKRGTSAGTAQGRRPRMGLCEESATHVTCSFCRPCRHPLAFLSGRFKTGSKNPFRFKSTHSPSQVRNSNISMISPLRVGPPTRRELVHGHAPIIFDREALRAPTHLLCGYFPDHSKYTTSSLITRAPILLCPRRATSHRHLSTIRDSRRR